MSHRIECPQCGRRDIEEFLYGEIPTVPDTVVGANERDLHRGFFRDNEAGVVLERWFHAYGCRRWLTVRHDTVLDHFVTIDV